MAWLMMKRRPLLSSLLLSMALCLLGMAMVQWRYLRQDKYFIGRHYKKSDWVMATLLEPPVPKAKSIKADASVKIVLPDGKLIPVKGNIILYLEKTGNAAALTYGSTIVFRKALQPIRNAGNPGSFDYAAYAARQGIFYQAFLKQNEYRQTAFVQGNHFQRQLFNIRQWVLQRLVQYIKSPDASGVAQALLIGYRGDLDKALVEQYANTGVVHIIAISGMHLGMIYTLLLVLLKPLGQSRRMQVLRLVIVLAIIWLFSFLTGAAPSITRAAIMFTLLSVGQLLYKNSSIYNTLSAAAILLLLINPYNLWDVGFQLSFAAVLSIAVFYQPILHWWTPKNWLLSKLWQLMAVTIAAQLLTLPFGVYHFHQFPVYFLLANLVAVPLSGLALYGLLLLLAFCWWPAAASAIGWLTAQMLVALNLFIQWVNGLPFTTLSHIQISLLQAALLLLLILLLAWWGLRRYPPALVAGLSSLVLFVAMQTWRVYHDSRQHLLVVYNIPQYTGIDYLQGRQSTFVGDTAIALPGFLQNFHVLPSRILLQSKPHRQLLLQSKTNTELTIGQQRWLILRSQIDYRRSKEVQADVLLISGNPPGNPARVLSVIKPRQIIIDGSNSSGRIARWKSAADSLHLRLHSVPDQGAYVVHLPAFGPGHP
ncbi:MAG TPA: ComEC/Rec2 family competence protein [Phnomibacter sp.]|nr:ComEC/Rec2 family competence protein [Phnomibacter sp.]